MKKRKNGASNGQTVTARIDFPNTHHTRQIMGERERNLRVLEKGTGARLSARGNRLTISGAEDAVSLASKAVAELHSLVDKGFLLSDSDVQKTLDLLSDDREARAEDVFLDTISVPSASRQIAPKSRGQKEYVDGIRNNTIVFSVGPAGTGKTYLAVAMAVAALFDRRFKRIVLARPAVEAGEKLGFLPGDIAEKVNPYLRPLYDALEDMMEPEKVKRLIEQSIIEIAPLAFMRGRTLNDSFVILDEAQNTTPEQMKMFLTRLGYNSQAVVTGDVTQVDLPPDKRSGLLHAVSLLDNIDDIGICYLSRLDVVRHPLVARIIEAYEDDTDS